MAVYNGEEYLRQALDSLLNQDFTDFELIISDNASTDTTEQICREYAGRDSRIRYHRNEENIGSAKNLNQVFGMASGQYFMWAAHDDLWGVSFISECVKALDENPSAILSCTQVEFIDRDTQILSLGYDPDHNFDSRNVEIRKRVRLLLSRVGGQLMYGLIRPEALRQTNLLPFGWGPDRILLLELCLLGEFVKVPKTLFFYRMLFKDVSTMMEDVSPAYRYVDCGSPYTTQLFDSLKVVWKFDKVKFNRLAVGFEALWTYLFRNNFYRRSVGEENVRKFRLAWRNKQLKKLLSAIVFLPLCLPEKINLLKKRNGDALFSAYKNHKYITTILHVPIYILLDLPTLFKAEAWGALGRLLKRSLTSRLNRQSR